MIPGSKILKLIGLINGKNKTTHSCMMITKASIPHPYNKKTFLIHPKGI